MKNINENGAIFIEKLSNNQKYPQYLCRCDKCVNTFVMWASHYYRGDNSCKCTKYASKNKRLYSIWINIKSRCNNPNESEYENYGGRGIKICEQWKNDFVTFYDWAMSHGYSDELTIDRIDNDGNYEPSNCRWAAQIEQANNKRNTIKIRIKDKTISLRRFCELIGLKYKTEHSYLTRHGYEAEMQRLNKFIELEDFVNED